MAAPNRLTSQEMAELPKNDDDWMDDEDFFTHFMKRQWPKYHNFYDESNQFKTIR